MLAEISQVEIWMLVGQLVMAIGTIGTLLFMVVGRNKPTELTANPPLDVRIVEEMHKQFALRSDFLEHVRDNDAQRGVLHKRVDDAVEDYNQKFQKLPNEIVALLRNTGNLKKWD